MVYRFVWSRSTSFTVLAYFGPVSNFGARLADIFTCRAFTPLMCFSTTKETGL